MSSTKAYKSIAEVVAAGYAHLPKSTVTKIVNSTFSAITSELEKTGSSRVYAFGKWEVRTRAARKGRNPQTGAPIDLPEKKYVAFRPSSMLTEKIRAAPEAPVETSKSE
eukprot:ANDGO_01957.mRNA.1 DNA-binding protein HU-1